MTLWRFESDQMKLFVQLDDDKRVVNCSAPARCFIGAKSIKLIKWMIKQGGFWYERLPDDWSPGGKRTADGCKPSHA